MNSALLLGLNTAALTALVMLQFQPPTEDTAQISQATPHYLQQQQRPQLAVMNATSQSPIRLAQDAQGAPASEHWVF